MNANITALRSGRTRALIQRPKRKMHVASIGALDADWLSLCGRWIPVDGTDADLRPTADAVAARSETFCSTCGWIFALVNFEVGRALDAAAARPTHLKAVR